MLTIKDLKVEFRTYDGITYAVNGVNLEVKDGEILGIVGESGSGKSVATHAITQLIPTPPGKITSGEIIFNGVDLLKLSEDEINKIRGKDIGMIFQEPMTSLNPVFTIENQIVESLKLHSAPMSRAGYRQKVIDALAKVGIPSPESRVNCYPHELSGGMRQRVMIAMALVCNPKLLIADEPTTALDVTIQAQILDIIMNLKKEHNLGVVLITHDLGVISETADKIAVMYAGKIVEQGTSDQVLGDPQHPYTKGLLESMPSYMDEQRDIEHDGVKGRLNTITGVVPDMRIMPLGCAFYNRCEYAIEDCKSRVQISTKNRIN